MCFLTVCATGLPFVAICVNIILHWGNKCASELYRVFHIIWQQMEKDRKKLAAAVKAWNESRLDLFAISSPNEVSVFWFANANCIL